MPNKAYWSQLEEILEFTQALTGESDAELKQSIKERKEKASDAPMEEITLASLASEFVEVFGETCVNYKNAKTQPERDAILDEIDEVSSDIFNTIGEEMGEAFDYLESRLKDIEEESECFYNDLDDIVATNPRLQKSHLLSSNRTDGWEYAYPEPGDHIRVERLGGLYTHHAIYIGNNMVIHFAPDNGSEILDWSSAKVRKNTLEEFSKGRKIQVKLYSEAEQSSLYSTEKIIENATRSLGKSNYNLLFNNCEHFANACTLGIYRSPQVEEFFNLVVSITE